MRLHRALWLIGLSACVSALPDLPPPTGDEVTIFIHGYRGAQLKTEDLPHDTAWLTIGETISGGSTTLARPFPGMREMSIFPPLLPAGPLTRFVVVPFIVERDIYLSWLDYAAQNLPGFVAFSYDWRRDVRESAVRLGRIVDSLEAKHAGPLRINLVAHSMGGLVALHWLRHGDADGAAAPTWAGAKHVRKVVFAGVPFRGSSAIFEDLLRGTLTGRNTALLSKEALFTFPSAWQLLPVDGRFFVDAAGEKSALDALDTNNWLENGWGVFEEPTLRVNEAYRRQLAQLVKTHDDLHSGLRELAGAAPDLEALAIVGTGRPTVDRVRTTVRGFDFDDKLTGDGDDTVPSASATPPKPLKWTRFDTPASHVGLLADTLVQREIARFLGAPAP